MHFSSFKKIILKVNDFDLPGKNSMINLAPPNRIKQINEGIKPKNPKHAAVLILFFPDKKNQTRIILILRNTYNGVHSNQVSFPGGKKEKIDHDLKFTAVRETIEELGLIKSKIQILSPISKVYIPPSNFNVQPFIGIYKEFPIFNPCDTEVSKIITPKLDNVLKMEVINSNVFIREKKIMVPSYVIQKKVVWGATAMMISEFITLFNKMTKS
tara:strand:+ start:3508 stop:4146 length:639 start_codon:yes stop_codon:yes gene_type:complete